MKLEVNIDRKYALIIIAILIMSVGVLGYNSAFSGTVDDAKLVGHSSDEIVVLTSSGEMTLQDAIQDEIIWQKKSEIFEEENWVRLSPSFTCDDYSANNYYTYELAEYVQDDADIAIVRADCTVREMRIDYELPSLYEGDNLAGDSRNYFRICSSGLSGVSYAFLNSEKQINVYNGGCNADDSDNDLWIVGWYS